MHKLRAFVCHHSRNAPLLKEVPEGDSDIQSGEKEGNIGVAEKFIWVFL